MDEATFMTAITDPQVLIRPTQRLSVSGNAVFDEADTIADQPILMEARLLELISSLQQLIHSNTLLDEALMTEQSNDNNDAANGNHNYDDELVAALKENEVVISKQMENAQSLSSKLRTRHGVFISLDDKIPKYNGSLFLRRLSEEEECKFRHSTTNVDDDGGMHL
jgi:ribosomal protein L16 Arg81 hydroxylase